jgi:hypothetical protein
LKEIWEVLQQKYKGADWLVLKSAFLSRLYIIILHLDSVCLLESSFFLESEIRESELFYDIW